MLNFETLKTIEVNKDSFACLAWLTQGDNFHVLFGIGYT